MAALTPPTAAQAGPATPTFVNMISLFLSSPSLATPQATLLGDTEPSNTTGGNTTATALASPAQIADAMIRSMLNGSTAGNPAPNGPVSSSTIASSITDFAFSDATAPAASSAVPTPSVTADTPGAGVNAATLAAVVATPGSKLTPETASTNQALRKPLRNAGDMASLTDAVTAPLVAPPLAPAVSSQNPSPAPNPKTDAGAAITSVQDNRNTAGSQGPGALTAPAAKSSPENSIAFTAILTPMKETTTFVSAANAPNPGAVNQILASPETTSATTSNASQPTATGSQSQIAIQAAAQQSGGENTGGDAPSQQDNSAQNPARPVADSSDTKVKPLKEDDPVSLEAAPGSGIDRIPVVSPLSSILTDQTHAAQLAKSDASTPEATPFQAAADTIRTSEPNLPPAPPLRTGAVLQIAIRIAQPDSAPVDLRVIERSGQVHVDVRTMDADMQTSLRQDLGTLTNSLERAGYHAEAFTPAARAASAAQMSGNMSDSDRGQDSSQGRNDSGNFSGDRRQQQQQKRSGNWLEETEDQL